MAASTCPQRRSSLPGGLGRHWISTIIVAPASLRSHYRVQVPGVVPYGTLSRDRHPQRCGGRTVLQSLAVDDVRLERPTPPTPCEGRPATIRATYELEPAGSAA